MRRIIPIVLLLIAGLAFAQSSPPTTVRVRLFSQEQPSVIRVTTPGGAVSVLDARELKTPFRSEGPVAIQRGTNAALRVPYPVEVSVRNGTLMILAKLPMEDYIAAVLAGESSGFRSDESMRAMAVTARTYAAHFLHRHESEGYNFCDSTHCQDLRLTAVTNRFRQAAAATSNEVLEYDGQPIAAYYHQNCGGVTEARAPYLIQMNDSFCTLEGRHTWSAELTASDLQSAIGVRDVTNIEVTERTASGRAQRLRISGAETRIMQAEPFRLAVGRTLGWNKVRSDLYDVRRSGARFVFEGHGAGHGIGMCQAGAAVMGEKGHTYKEILAYYFPGATIARMK
jgi:stage II sporulation protein D